MNAILNIFAAHPVAVGFAAFVGPIFAFAFYQQFIRPMLIPKSVITEMADDLIEKYGFDAEHHAYIREDRAWRYSDAYHQGRWRRIRRKLQRRHNSDF